MGISTGAQAQTVEEHDAKAAFVLKLVNFVQWPGDASRDLVIGFIGADATGDALQRLAYGKPVKWKGNRRPPPGARRRPQGVSGDLCGCL